MKVLANNKKAYFNFEISDKLEAGIVLQGWEVKSIKNGRMSLAGSFIKSKDNELFLVNSSVPLWTGGLFKGNENELRERKLLLNSSEIRNITNKSKQDRYTIVPLEVYQNDKGGIKILIALAKGKKKFDKRAKLKERDLKRRIDSDRKKYNF